MSDLIMPVAKITAQVDLEDIKAGLEKEDIVRVVRCKDCKHRPKRLEEGKGEGFNLEFPDYNFVCPCQCDDGWYNWIPDDNWFCGNGERKEECMQ